MDSRKDGNFIFIRMHEGENIFENLNKIMDEYKIITGIILSSVGMFENVELGYFNGKEYEKKIFSGCYELLSLQGNLTKQTDGNVIHLHSILGNEDTSVFGGHLLNASIKVTNEMIIMVSDVKITRKLESNNLKGWSFS
ncbi:MAG: DNA-binding protein [bacterium]|nr:DNA-binding protein [bacterium]